MANRGLIIFYRILVLLKIVSLATELNVICHISADNELKEVDLKEVDNFACLEVVYKTDGQ